MLRFLESLLGPNLNRIRKAGAPGFNYIPNRVETLSGYTLLAVRCLWFLCKLSSPLWLIALYNRRSSFSSIDAFSIKDFDWIIRPFAFVVTVAGAAYVARGLGRCFNPEYAQFIRSVSHYRRHKTSENAEHLTRLYDCDFSCVPVEYAATAPLKRPAVSVSAEQKLGMVWKLATLLLLRTVGRRLLYPGSLQFIKTVMGPALVDGRAQLLEDNSLKAKRGKVQTADGNFIDTVFVDRRGLTPQGNVLVICCEGNAGFYEVGIMATPIRAGYSVLGWNHPGFGCSTGEPMPTQELHAVDAMMQYATKHMHFSEREVMVFAWSIGGFPAAWLAATYPSLRGVLLDATFDDLLPLALARMPKPLGGLVTRVVRHYLNLNVAELLCRYDGPVLLIRRTLDEIIATEDLELNAMINRGDYLLKRLLLHRYPNVVNGETLPLLDKWLRSSRHDRAALDSRFLGEQEDRLIQTLDEYLVQCSVSSPYDISFPLPVGANCDLTTRQHLTLYLAHLHMKDIEATHCTPLPVELFRHPWHPIRYSDVALG
ncbi:Protein ABHD16A [Hypsibius exemplaris]|uniref:Protein ABHD16A n=1 Tax=Hypsibius exemplaris TaxID=2072580 RepID=A0A1W0W888_HYPEX|nr:Protein ABHD16A [Hypsibius exemplaris]